MERAVTMTSCSFELDPGDYGVITIDPDSSNIVDLVHDSSCLAVARGAVGAVAALVPLRDAPPHSTPWAALSLVQSACSNLLSAPVSYKTAALSDVCAQLAGRGVDLQLQMFVSPQTGIPVARLLCHRSKLEAVTTALISMGCHRAAVGHGPPKQMHADQKPDANAQVETGSASAPIAVSVDESYQLKPESTMRVEQEAEAVKEFNGDASKRHEEEPVPIATATGLEVLKEGSKVKYWSQSVQRWVTGTVLRCNDDGSFDLDLKRRAKAEFIRPAPPKPDLAAGVRAPQQLPAGAQSARLSRDNGKSGAGAHSKMQVSRKTMNNVAEDDDDEDDEEEEEEEEQYGEESADLRHKCSRKKELDSSSEEGCSRAVLASSPEDSEESGKPAAKRKKTIRKKMKSEGDKDRPKKEQKDKHKGAKKDTKKANKLSKTVGSDSSVDAAAAVEKSKHIGESSKHKSRVAESSHSDSPCQKRQKEGKKHKDKVKGKDKGRRKRQKHSESSPDLMPKAQGRDMEEDTDSSKDKERGKRTNVEEPSSESKPKNAKRKRKDKDTDTSESPQRRSKAKDKDKHKAKHKAVKAGSSTDEPPARRQKASTDEDESHEILKKRKR